MKTKTRFLVISACIVLGILTALMVPANAVSNGYMPADFLVHF